MPLPFERVVETIRHGEPAACYLLSGPDGFQRRAVLDALGPLAGALGPTVLDGADVTAAAVVGALRSPALGGGRLVVVRDAPWVVAGGAEGKAVAKAAPNTPLLEYLDRPVPGAVLVLCTSQPADRRRRLVRRTVETGVHLEAVAPRDGGQWLRQRAAHLGLKLDRDTQQTVQGRLEGATCERIDQELRKLASYGPGLDRDVLERLLPPNVEERIYTLVDACLAGDGQRVTALAQTLLAQGEPVALLLFSLAAQLRTIAQVAGNPGRAGELGLPPFVLRKAADQARRLTPAAWASASRAVWEAELAWKSGRWTEPAALDNALIGVLAAARGAAGTPPATSEPLRW